MRLGFLALGCVLASASAASPPAPASAVVGATVPVDAKTDLAGEDMPLAVRSAADVAKAGDAKGMPFVIVDKENALVFAFDPVGRLLGVAPALLGLARGDISPPGIGDKPLAKITPAERITPAGRFVASIGNNLGAKDVLWVDYASALSLHRVITTKAAERRLDRLASKSAADNRITYGCINVPAIFFDRVVRPAFSKKTGIVYILAEDRPENGMLK